MTDFVSSTDGTAIAYESVGEGPVLVLVGGAFSSRRSMRPLADLLAPRFEVFVYDRRGRGDSGPTAWVSAEQQVDDLLAVTAVPGRAMVFGHSSGGVLALLAASESPAITRVAAYEPPLLTDGGPDPTATAFAAELRALLEAGRDEEATVAWFTRTSGGRFDDGMRSLPWWPSLVAVAHSLPDERTLIGDGRVPDRFGAIAVPTLLLHGGASPAWAAESCAAVAATIRGARVASVPDEGHIVRFEALVPVLEPFLRP
jgi:pimeloyl-ACP methyl ester carboxylesterase